ncbi:hpt domain containing protein [Stylonychia lemnae]|uniref:Hpt domain containing protein n=1 Tax=Stylonychia lemnae TaxID=5949 RepID=A0A078A6W4_STYLE|nr:hpt domain containing protein [Stylonychia lemnae]|eukprot:CDW76464.1 hpt domain containing protein [Stylonychia lemnae]
MQISRTNIEKQDQTDKEVRVLDIDISVPIDVNFAMKTLGLPDLFYMMIAQFEVMTMNEQLERLCRGIQKQDWKEMKVGAHNLKGSAGYIGVSRLHYAAYYVQLFYVNHNYDQMVAFYPLIIETAVEFKIEYKKLLAEKNQTPLVLTPEDEQVIVAPGYRLIKYNDKLYCVHQDQSVQEREKQHKEQMRKPSKFQGTQGDQVSNSNTINQISINNNNNNNSVRNNIQINSNANIQRQNNNNRNSNAFKQQQFQQQQQQQQQQFQDKQMISRPSNQDQPVLNNKSQINQLTNMQLLDEENKSQRSLQKQQSVLQNLKDLGQQVQIASERPIELRESQRYKQNADLTDQMRQISNKSKQGLKSSHRRDPRDSIDKQIEQNKRLFQDEQQASVDECQCLKSLCPDMMMSTPNLTSSNTQSSSLFSNSQCLIF